MKYKYSKIKFSFIGKLVVVFLLINILIPKNINAQDELGIYSVKNFSSKEYNGMVQNWSIVQDSRGVIYAANDQGILEYDGTVWRTILISALAKRGRSLAISEDGTIYVGAVEDFGYLKPDTIGNLKYISLTNLLDSSQHKYVDKIWDIFCTEDGVYFISDFKVFLYNGKSIKIFHARKGIGIDDPFIVNNKLFVRLSSKGLATIKGDSLFAIRGAEKLCSENYFMDILPLDGNAVIVLTYHNGLIKVKFDVNGNVLKIDSFPTQIDSFLKKCRPTKIRYINNKDIAIGTPGDGVLIFDKQGSLKYVLNKETGLQNQVVRDMFVDANSNLWLALNNGISKVEINSPITHFQETTGLKETVESITRFNSKLYIATHTGLYYLNKQEVLTESDDNSIYKLPYFTKITNKIVEKECYDIIPFKHEEKDVLLIATSNSVLELDKDDKINPIYEGSVKYACYPWCIHPLKKMPNRIIIGADPGLYSARYENGKWIKEGKVEGINNVVYKIFEEDNGTVWLGTVGEAIRIDKYHVEGNKLTIEKSKSFKAYTEEGQINGPIYVQEFKDKLVFGTSKGLYYYSEEQDSLLSYEMYKDKIFAPDSSFFESFLSSSAVIHRLKNDEQNRLWFIAMLNDGKLMTVLNTEPESDKINYVFVDDSREFIQTIYHDEDNYIWLGGSNGLIKYDDKIIRDSVKLFNAITRRVVAGNDILFNGAFYDESGNVILRQPDFMIPEIKYKNNSLVFYFSAISGGDQTKVMYSFFLEGNDDDWSNWENVTNYPYTNLREGTYYFRVKARDIYGNISQESVYEFIIKPPWYRTIWAYILYVIIFILIVYIAIQVSTRSLRKIVQERTAEIREQKEEIEEANEELNQQNEEITAQRDEIETQRNVVVKQKEEIEGIHHEISESINYATRLQEAILPEEKILEKYLSEHFLFFNPKDKVSGDFYWWTHQENHTIITASDCTGHGVPGAFMSMLGVSFLREIVQKEYITHTGVILKKLRKEIIKTLKQTGKSGTQKDGMDMAIISIDHETNIVQYSGANNPLYLLTNRELPDLTQLDGFENFYEIKPDKMPIAIYEKMDNFTAHEIQLEKGDQLYMFSDGYADQFGGPKGKKFKYKPFKSLLSENKNKPMKVQKELLDKAFEDWKGNLEQIDDVVVLGIKI